jgi:hypothetical protein
MGRKVSSVRWPRKADSRYHGEQLSEMAIMMYLSLGCRTPRQRRVRDRDDIRAMYS